MKIYLHLKSFYFYLQLGVFPIKYMYVYIYIYTIYIYILDKKNVFNEMFLIGEIYSFYSMIFGSQIWSSIC